MLGFVPFPDIPAPDTFYLIFFAAMELAGFLLIWRFCGKEPKVDISSIYEREPPYAYSPALVDALIHQDTKKPGHNSIAAELLDMCLKGLLDIRRMPREKSAGVIGGDDYEIRIIGRSTEGLPRSEKKLFRLIEKAAKEMHKGSQIKENTADDSPDRLTLTELGDYLKANSLQVSEWLTAWTETVSKEAKEMKFFSGDAGYIFFAAYVLILNTLSMLQSPSAWVTNTLIVEAAVLVSFFPEAIPRRTHKGAEHYVKWMRFKRFLKDFSRLKEVPPDSIVLWEKYLVYSIPLGVAKNVQKSMDDVFQGYYLSGVFGVTTLEKLAGRTRDFSAQAFGAAVNRFSSAFVAKSDTSGSSDKAAEVQETEDDA
ncbi:MAG: DUF2207 domain-containing protein [Candidatus Altiarchaeota archaeon]|nr:DUF2207 domain-containing protein [Candidatus Altiarchaeota archaeon]